MDYYELKIGKLERKLPVVSLGPKIKVASVNLLGDRKLVVALAKDTYQKIKNINFDYLVGPEVKVVPLLYELSHLFNKDHYVVCRKEIHGYMVYPQKSKTYPPLILNGGDAEMIKGKKVIIIDDVMTSGKTISAVADLMRKANATIVAKIAIFKQGDRLDQNQKDVIFLHNLPVFSS